MAQTLARRVLAQRAVLSATAATAASAVVSPASSAVLMTPRVIGGYVTVGAAVAAHSWRAAMPRASQHTVAGQTEFPGSGVDEDGVGGPGSGPAQHSVFPPAVDSTPASQHCVVHVSNIAADVDAEALYGVFNRFGAVTQCKVIRDRRGVNRGYGFVTFAEPESADAAIRECRAELAGRVLTVSHAVRNQGESEDGQRTKVFVRNLSPDVTQSQLRDAFAEVGRVVVTRIPTDQDGAPRGFGFVVFASEADATAAVEKLNGSVLGGSELSVTFGLWRRLQPGASLYVDGLAPEVSDEQLKEFFNAHGALDAMVKRNNRGQSRGYGFVYFGSRQAAREALRERNFALLANSPITLAPSHRTGWLNTGPPRNIYVANLPASTSGDDLSAAFQSNIGGVLSADVVRDDTGSCNGTGFVRFETEEQAAEAIAKLNGQEVCGSQVVVRLANRIRFSGGGQQQHNNNNNNNNNNNSHHHHRQQHRQFDD